MNFDIQLVKLEDMIPLQQAGLDKLNKECFGDIPDEESKEDFFAEPFAYLFAMIGNQMISRVALFKRKVIFAGHSIALGGIGGVCVGVDYRHHGVASSMVKRGLVILKEEGCDVACLNVDLEKKIYSLYTKLGFVMMERDISFENVHGEIKHESGTMFAPLNSPEKFELIMNSTETFHYGRGYW